MILVWLGAVLAATCPAYDSAVSLGDLGAAGPSEASGLARSRARPGVFYTHDDSGDPVLFALDADGLIGEHRVTGADIVDWEDIASGPCPDGGDCLYIGDIGDNDSSRAWVTIYVVGEPARGEDAVVQASWRVQWPDGAVDAETLLVHPLTGEVSLVSKDPSGVSLVGRVPADPGATIATLDVVASLLLQGGDEGERLAAGGAWDPDGDRLVIRARERVLEWRTDPCDPDGHWADTPSGWTTPATPRAEGVAYGDDGSLVYVAEGFPAPLSAQACPDAVAGTGECLTDAESTGCCSGDADAAWLVLPLVGLARRRRGPSRG